VEAKSVEGRAKLKARFSVAWGEAFVDTSDLDLILKAMRYIANKQDIEQMEMASPSMRRQLYEDWWKARDPDPSTPENELRQEFFRRLDFANRYFSVPEMNIEGWETDRGRIYIIYGPPTHVEREPAEMNEASYETWYYSHLHRRFVFVDKSGTGLYELVKSD
jgi:GWxTD domain-containing protein